MKPRPAWHGLLSWAFVAAGIISWLMAGHRAWFEARLGVPGLAWILNGFLAFAGAVYLRVSDRRGDEAARLGAELRSLRERERFLESRNAALQTRVELLSAMREVTRATSGELRFEPVVTEVFGIVEGLLSTEVVALFFPERDRGLRLAALREDGGTRFGQEAGADGLEGFDLGVAETAWRAGRAHREGQSVAVPLAGEGAPLGVLAVRLEPGQDAEAAAATMTDLAKHVTQAVQNPALRRAALMDALTGLYTKRHFLEQAPALVAQQRERGAPLALLMCDLDHFKRINDSHGHPAGDQVLREAARRVLTCVRESDTAYRYGGEEIVCLLPGASVQVASRVGGRICREMAATPVSIPSGDALPVTVSVGVAVLTPAMETWEDLLTAADKALYEAKHTGRNRVVTAS